MTQNKSQGKNFITYGVAASVGSRDHMEDRSCCIISLAKPGLEEWSFFAVFDGHGGSFVSNYLSKKLLKSILNADEQLFDALASKTLDLSEQDTQNRLKDAIQKAFLDTDQEIRNTKEMRKIAQKFPGSTAVACLISPTHSCIINCGDSRGIFVSDNLIKTITRQHVSLDPDEDERVTRAGGTVNLDRVILYKEIDDDDESPSQYLNVTRSFGDFSFKKNKAKSQTEQIVLAKPEIYVNRRSTKDEFIVLANGAVWQDTKNLDHFKDYIRFRLTNTHDLSEICQLVTEICSSKVYFYISFA